jgi:hypothetical protein
VFTKYLENVKGKCYYLKDLGLDGRKILKWVIKQGVTSGLDSFG